MHDYSEGLVSLDSETLAHVHNGIILSVGFCFHPWEKPNLDNMKKNSINFKLDVADQIKNYGFVTRQSVVDWWKEQDKEAKKILLPSSDDIKLADLTKAIDDWFLSIGVKWRKCDTFDRKAYDINRLQYVYEDVLGISTPWNHGHVYEFGTALAFMGSDRYGGIREPSSIDPSFIYHNSRDDAIVDAYRLLNQMDKNGVLDS